MSVHSGAVEITPESALGRLRVRAKSDPKRIIFPEQNDPRVLDAIQLLRGEKLCRPIILAPPERGKADCEIFSGLPEAASMRESAVTTLVQIQQKNKLTPEQARLELENPLLLAAVLLRMGYADAGIAGSIATTAEVVRAGLRGLGLGLGQSLVSSIFLMEWPDKVFTFGDCGVNPAPNSSQLAQIAIDSADTHRLLTGQSPRVALLSFSTKGSADHAEVYLVRDALAQVRKLRPDLAVDGELQFDAASVPAIASRKAPGSPVAGNCNVYIFPNLSAGNIAYKITERLGGARATGPVLQGFARPWLDLSRGCDSEDIVNAALIASAMAAGSRN